MSRVVLVTGGAGGIGLAVAEAFAAAGDTVVSADVGFNDPDTLVSRGHVGHSFYELKLDVSSETQVVNAFDLIEQQLGPVAVLVAVAGILTPSSGNPVVTGTSIEMWEQANGVNSTGTFLCVRELLLRRRTVPVPEGRIITFTSIGAQQGVVTGSVGYAASKAAVMGITRTAAKEGAPLGITANCVSPAMIDTPMLEAGFPGSTAALIESVPLGRLGRPSEVAALVEFLASPAAGFITATTIDINGGTRVS